MKYSIRFRFLEPFEKKINQFQVKTLNGNLDHIQVICDNVSQSKSPTKAKYSIKIAGTVQKDSIYVKLAKPLTVIFSCSIKKMS